MLNSRKHIIPSAKSKKSKKSIGHDEPVFLLRANDKRSVKALLLYADACDCLDQFAAVMEVRQEFIEWQKNHPELVKEPTA